MTGKFIKTSRDASLLSITLNRPELLNSFNREMALELKDVLLGASSDQSVRAILLTGEGRAFCAGQDLAEVSPRPDGTIPDLGEIVSSCYNPITLLLRKIEKPVLCAVNGVAAGAGANLSFACDIVLASTEASFIQSFSKVGLISDSGGTFFLPRLIGLSRAAALTMLGDKLSAKQAYDIGLVYKIFEPSQLLNEARTLATQLAAQPTTGLGLMKRALNQSLSNNLEAQLKLEEEFQRTAGKTYDYREGVTAFIEKRKPVFKGI